MKQTKISVKDFGPGISPKDQHRIFEKYYRVQTNADRIPGTGMGLAIARVICRGTDESYIIQAAIESFDAFVFRSVELQIQEIHALKLMGIATSPKQQKQELRLHSALNHQTTYHLISCNSSCQMSSRRYIVLRVCAHNDRRILY